MQELQLSPWKLLPVATEHIVRYIEEKKFSATLALPCHLWERCVWLKSWGSCCSESLLWVLGSQGSIVPMKERSSWADDTVYWNCSDVCASVLCLCFLAKIGYRPSVMSHWFFSEMWNLFSLAPSCVLMILNEQNTCKNRIISSYSWKNIGSSKSADFSFLWNLLTE